MDFIEIHENVVQRMDAFRGLLHPSIELTTSTELKDDLDCEVLIYGFPNKATLAKCKNLKHIIVPWAGAPADIDQTLKGTDITVHTIHHNCWATAEMGFTLLVSAMKKIVECDRRFRSHDWTTRYGSHPPSMIRGRTVAIVGYGAVGSKIGQMCLAMGMNVVPVTRSAAQPASDKKDASSSSSSSSDRKGIQPAFPSTQLRELLPRIDALVICVPHTSQTDGLIGKDELTLLPQHAVLVNVSRGPVVQEEALFNALKDKQIATAGLDVWYAYPSDLASDVTARESSQRCTHPSRFPFHELENAVMSPHRGGHLGTEEIDSAKVRHLAHLLNLAQAGEPLPPQLELPPV